jgi:hypothetical protein
MSGLRHRLDQRQVRTRRQIDLAGRRAGLDHDLSIASVHDRFGKRQVSLDSFIGETLAD